MPIVIEDYLHMQFYNNALVESHRKKCLLSMFPDELLHSLICYNKHTYQDLFIASHQT
jgi:hypothetical protein